MTSRWIRATEVAKLVRQHLRTNYPGTRFRVRTEHGSTVRVYVPKDYPEGGQAEIHRDLSPWGSSGFDGMTDSSYSKGHTLCPEHGVTLTYVGAHWGSDEIRREPCCSKAESVHLGASYVFVSREWRD